MLNEKNLDGTIVAIFPEGKDCSSGEKSVADRCLSRGKIVRVHSPQPIDRKGRKFIDCPFYGECLMQAARDNWDAWTCEECPYVGLDLICQKLRYIAPYYRLFAEINPEFKRKYEPVINSLEIEV